MRDLTRRAERTTHNLDVGRRGEAYLTSQEGMEGDGIFDVFKSAGRLLGRLAGSKVGQDVIGALQAQLPNLASAGAERLGDVIRGRPRQQQQEGEGLMLAGQRGRAMKPAVMKEMLMGQGLMLAGKGMRKKKGHSKKMLMNYM